MDDHREPPEVIPPEVLTLEARVHADPNDAEARADLLSAHADTRFLNRPQRLENILWHVRHRPRDHITRTPFTHISPTSAPEAFAAVEREWVRQHEEAPDVEEILCGYAAFCSYRSPDFALSLLQRFVERHPQAHEAFVDIGRMSRDPIEKLRAFQHARALGSTAPNLLTWIGQAALELNDISTLEATGHELMAQVDKLRASYGAKLDWPDNNESQWDWASTRTDDKSGARRLSSAISEHANLKHWAHTFLGIAALRAGDTQRALAHLHKSAESGGDFRMRSYGPSFLLAAELSRAGCFDGVASYLQTCGTFWENDILTKWRSALAEKRVPTFSDY